MTPDKLIGPDGPASPGAAAPNGAVFAPAPEDPSDKRPSTAGMTTKVVKGSLWTLAGQVAPLAVSLVTTPFTIRLLGAEGYGVLILVALIPTYLGFADFGMSMASTKFGSEAYGEGDEEKEGRVVRTAALIALMSSVPVAALLIIFAGSVISLFNVPPDYVAEATLALRLAAVTFVINILCSIFNTPQLARLRMDLNTLINAIPRILGLIATPIVIYLGYGIVGAIAVLLIASTVNLTGHLIVSRRLLSHLIGNSIEVNRLTAMTKFGFAFVISGIAAIALVNAEKGILAATVSATALGYYAVALSLARMMTLFSGAMTQSLMPAFSQLQTEDRRSQLNSIYSRGIRLSLIWIVPIMVILAVVARPFFTLWAGPEFGNESSRPFYLLLGGLAFNILAYLPHTAIIAAGRTDVLAKLYWLELLPYAFIVWFLASRYGASGAAGAWSIRVIADAAIQFILAKRLAGVSYSIRRPGYFGIALLIMTVPILSMIYIAGVSVLLLAITFICFAVYAGLAWKTLIEKSEIDWLLNRLHQRFAR